MEDKGSITANQSKTVVPPELRYRAFISYSHNDAAHAKWLHRQLERYRIPPALSASSYHATHFRPVFRDREDLSAGPELSTSIEAALRSSENLIVMCSPDAARSEWVNEEILIFKALGREDHIFSVIIGGVPFASHPNLECLPPALRGTDGVDEKSGPAARAPLAADFRPQGDGRKVGLKKLIAGLLDVRLDQLLQRDLIRARRRLGVTAGAALSVITALSVLSYTAYSAQQRAEARRADAENFVEYLLSDLSVELERFGRLDLLDSVGEKAINYYNQFDDSDFNLKVNGRRARTLHFMGGLQDKLGETARAEDYFSKSYQITAEGLSLHPDDPDRIFEHARSTYLKSLPFRRVADYAGEMICFKEFIQLSERLMLAETGSARARIQLATANMNVGRVKIKQGQPETAKEDLYEAVDLFTSVLEQAPTVDGALNLSEALSWQAESYRVQGDIARTYIIRQQQAALMTRQVENSPTDFRLLEGSVYANLGFGNAAALSGENDTASSALNQALTSAQAALILEPRREKMMRAQAAALSSLMMLAIVKDDEAGFYSLQARLSDLMEKPKLQAVTDNTFWSEGLPKTLAWIEQDFVNMRAGRLDYKFGGKRNSSQ